MHDDTVDRTTSGSGEVGRMTLAEIQSLDAGSYVHPKFADQRIPTYQDVLEAVHSTGTSWCSISSHVMRSTISASCA